MLKPRAVCFTQGMSMEAIASQRTLQLGTVQSYIAEAMAAGYPYPWHRMGVPQCLLASLCSHVRAYHKQRLQQAAQMPPQQQQQQLVYQEQLQLQGGQQRIGQLPMQQGGRPELQGQQEAEHGDTWLPQPLGLQQQAQLQRSNSNGGVKQSHAAGVVWTAADHPAGPEEVLPARRLKDGGAVHQTGYANCPGVCRGCGLVEDQSRVKLGMQGLMPADELPLKVGGTAGQAGQLPDIDLLTELVLTGQGTKALRDSMDDCPLTYGPMRLALAHIYCLLRNSVCMCKQKS